VDVGIVPAFVKLCWYFPPLAKVKVVALAVIVPALITVPDTDVVEVVPLVTFQTGIVPAVFNVSVPAILPVVPVCPIV
jgi:hypothetical protein